MNRALALVCCVVAFVALATFEYTLWQTGPLAAPSSGDPTGILSISFMIAVGAGLVTSVQLGDRVAVWLWVLLFVPIGFGFAYAGLEKPSETFTFYAIGLMFVVMGIFPLFAVYRRRGGSDF